MASFRQGDRAAAGELMEMFYTDLRRLAAAKMKGERLHRPLHHALLSLKRNRKTVSRAGLPRVECQTLDAFEDA